jgi:hypothetical protein
MFLETALGGWSAAGIAWWVMAAWLVTAESKRSRRVSPAPLVQNAQEFLSIFKPLPPLEGKGLGGVAAGLESFLVQLDDECELLLGVHEADRAVVAAFLARLRGRYPETQLRTIFRSAPDDVANPKIAWQKVLASEARGELWLWSDADIRAPAGFLRSVRGEYARSGAAMLTFPYVVREPVSRAAVLDALYVNAEFYPGVLLLRKLGPVDFGLGAGMLFRRSDFLRVVDWGEIGSALADDFVLGQKLRPVRLGETTLATGADISTWKEAVLHYLRWNRTVWWNRPYGAAARVVTLPVLGWLADVVFHPGSPGAWAGLAGMMQVDVLFAVALLRGTGCQWKVRDLLGMEAWSLGRVGVWAACWLPWPVRWRGRHWWTPNLKSGKPLEGEGH